TRGQGRGLRGVGALGKVIDWLRAAPDVETVSAVAFPVEPAAPQPQDAPKENPTQELKFQAVESGAGPVDRQMPGAPEETTEDLGNGLKRHSFDVPVSGKINCHVSYIDLAAATVEGKDPQEVMKVFRSGYRAGTEPEGDKEITLGKERVPGREYRL